MEKEPLIYIVDDIIDTAELLAHFLSSSGYKTRIFSGGAELMQALLPETSEKIPVLPDLILLDLMMPGMDGIEVIRRVRSSITTTYIPIIMITSSGESQNRILGLQTGADDFLTKPISRAELLARVRSLLRLKQAYDEKDHLLAEVKGAYERLSAAQGELVEVEKRRLQMDAMMTTAAGICHEMSQPLTSALITLQLMRQVENDYQQEDIDTIETSLLQARVILDKLRALTRYETKPYLGQELILDIDRSSDSVILDYNPDDSGENNPGKN
ncbi:MAG TPA: response regulator [Chloroflexia bacterium]|nr:response regulator [Chloroflexia bacterium]